MDEETLYMSAALFAVSLSLSMLPSFFKRIKKVKSIFPYAIITSAGFMLSSIFIDFIPHLMENTMPHSHSHNSHNHFSLGLFLSGLSFIMLLAIDVLVLHHSHCDSKEAAGGSHGHGNEQHKAIGSCTEVIKYSTSKAQALFFMAAISVHSFFEGLAFYNHAGHTFRICIFIHKIIESFSLGLTVFSAGVSYAFGFLLMLVYSILTPAGIEFVRLLRGWKTTRLSNICDGLALGSVMFIVFVEIIPVVFHGHREKMLNMILLLSGYCIPFLAALALEK